MGQMFFLLSIILLGAASRILPHLPNFTPIGAIALFSGYYFKNRNFGLLPLIIMALSDLFIGGYYGPVMFYVYGSFFLIYLLGKFFLKRSFTLPRLLCSSLLASALFFVITNFAVWLHTPLYAKDVSGLLTSYIAAIPFFRATLVGDLFYSLVIFLALSLALRRQQKTAPRAAESL